MDRQPDLLVIRPLAAQADAGKGSGMNVTTREARIRLGSLIERAREGEPVIITRYGRPAARLVATKENAMTVERYEKELIALAADPTRPAPSDLRGAELKQWERLKKQVQEIIAQGGIVDAPFEMP